MKLHEPTQMKRSELKSRVESRCEQARCFISAHLYKRQNETIDENSTISCVIRLARFVCRPSFHFFSHHSYSCIFPLIIPGFPLHWVHTMRQNWCQKFLLKKIHLSQTNGLCWLFFFLQEHQSCSKSQNRIWWCKNMGKSKSDTWRIAKREWWWCGGGGYAHRSFCVLFLIHWNEHPCFINHILPKHHCWNMSGANSVLFCQKENTKPPQHHQWVPLDCCLLPCRDRPRER